MPRKDENHMLELRNMSNAPYLQLLLYKIDIVKPAVMNVCVHKTQDM